MHAGLGSARRARSRS